MVKVSVIMPIYNAEKYLKTALDSLMCQTLQDFELICVNDGSTDGSPIILQEYAKMDSRIRIMNQPNRFAGVARNLGMSQAKGEYLSFLDADDYFKPEMLEKAYQCAKTSNGDVVIFDGQRFHGTIEEAYPGNFLKKNFLPAGTSFHPSDFKDCLFQVSHTAPWDKLYKREFILRKKIFFQPVERINDAYFVIMALANANVISIVREELIYYRCGNDKSLQGRNAKTPLLFAEVLLEIKKGLIRYGKYDCNLKSFHTLCIECNYFILKSLTDKNTFITLYDALKNYYFEQFGLIGTKEEDYCYRAAYIRYRRIMACPAEKCWLSGIDIDYTFPFMKVKKGSNVVLYAAGRVGKAYYKQLRQSEYCNIVGWADKNTGGKKDKRIAAPDMICYEKCDYVVIAVKYEGLAQQIRNELTETYQVDPQKIIWEAPSI